MDHRVSLFGALLLSGAQAAHAADEPAEAENGLSDIIVTAERRSQSIQDVPIALTALTGTDLDDRNIVTVEDLFQSVPGMRFSTAIGQAYINIRGVGGEPNATGDPSVAFHIDGIYVPRMSSVLSAGLFDVERVEVLRGPQGTLYGRNATGGAINVISRAADLNEFGGEADVTVGRFDRWRLRGAVNIPIVDDKIALRISGTTERRNGFTDNLSFPGTHEDLNDRVFDGGRAELRFEPADGLSIALRANYNVTGGNGQASEIPTPFANPIYTAPFAPFMPTSPFTPFAYGGPANPTEPYVTYQDTPSRFRLEAGLYGIQVDQTFGGGLLAGTTLTAIFGYTTEDNAFTTEFDRAGARVTEAQIDQRNRAYSGELRLSSDAGGETDWTIGAYAFREDLDSQTSIAIFLPGPFLAATVPLGQSVRADSRAVFGQITQQLTGSLKGVAGLRYTSDRKRGFNDAFTSARTADSDAVTGKIGLDYALNEDAMVYASVTRGYRSGGFGLTGQPYLPETLWAYEIGSKNILFDRLLTFNASAFYYDQRNLQVSFTEFGNLFVGNADGAENYGAEAELVFHPDQQLNLNASVALLKTRIGNYFQNDPAIYAPPGSPVRNWRGSDLAQSPEFTFTLGGSYALDLPGGGSLEPRFNIYHSAQYNLRIFANPRGDIQPAFTTVDLGVKWASPDRRWVIDAFVDNLTDVAIAYNATATGFLPNPMAAPLIGNDDLQLFYGAPRTWGLRVGFTY